MTQTMRPLPTRFACRLVGMTFTDVYPAASQQIELALFKSNGAAVWADLVRMPDNPADVNAVAVVHEGIRLGYIPAYLASRLAPELDAERRWECHITEIVTHPENPLNPGIAVSLERTL